MSDALEALVARCKGEVMLCINPHRSVYLTKEMYLGDREEDFDVRKELPALLATDLYEMQFYPDTPIGSYLVFGRSLAEVVDMAHRVLDSVTPTQEPT